MKEVRLFRNKYKELNLSSTELLGSVTSTAFNLYFNYEAEGDAGYSIDINRHANMMFVDLADLRFQFFPEEFTYESVCDFLIDNLTSYNVSGVMIEGEFKYRDGKLLCCDEKMLRCA